MSKLLISQYHSEVEKIIQYGGSRKETSIRVAFQNLLNEYCKLRDFLLIPELDYQTKSGNVVYPDGTVKDALRLDWGYWESKDQYDNLDVEIEKKLSKGYPNDNILFEDSQQVVLIQGGEEKLRVSVRDVEGLDTVLNAFINYVRPEVKDFREAIESFTEDLPTIVEALRELIAKQSEENKRFIEARNKFLKICQDSINPEISLLDVREMIIQHILTEDIFINIFNESQFHRENNIARELQGVIDTFFTGTTKRNTLGTIERYYAVIRRTAASIYNHQEKQKFLKSVYENFYKAYNPKAADRLGIVYTPNEIVRFMIESVDYLVHKHFGKLLCDPGVEILDPATGTGTFITELIEYLPKDKLKYKYQNEIHCNEVAILPYYIANLNIEYTYKQKMGEYEEFDHICFVDTLDNTSFTGKQLDLFAMTVENTQRIKDQNDRQISVIIGNPPYNAKQENFNQNNANRKYTEIDKLIKDTYIKQGTAQNKNVVYDMYTRFIRWASDRLNKDGIIAFITNSSFLDALAFDGFRKSIKDEFSYAYFIDCGGNVRAISGKDGIFICEKHTIFGTAAMTGIAILFLVKDSQATGNKIFYANPFHVHELRENKLSYLQQNSISKISFEHIHPNKKNNWLNQANNDFDDLLPLMDKEVKAGKSTEAIFKLFSSGLKTHRDEWVYDFSQDELEKKMKFFINTYQKTLEDNDYTEKDLIKWDADLKQYLKRNISKEFDNQNIVESLYRPYIKEFLYFDKHFNGRTYQWFNLYQTENKNYYICLSGVGGSKPFQNLVTYYITCLDCLEKTQCLPLYTYDEEGNRIDNITDWGLEQIQTHYQDKSITKLDIFHYTYGVLHNPEYRQKYELNLKREFPHLPLYENFFQWVEWGQKLMDLHINYETVEPYPLNRIDIPLKNENATPKPKLKADKPKGIIIIDDITQLQNIPAIAWDYKLGNRCALEWILDQYKEKKPKDQTIAEKFNNYRFSDYKEIVIDLLQKVCCVSVETMKIIEEMERK
ncbi:adenine specific DNA methyltransferase [Rippkaea orientalis PCC 8801]|uniref:site-specific DNA-methyltransferase (adenine-specific) n=1 Tax=Rippkaea orientalis (strain PCC 8801 / RF-1) TaxID=41431 RepID=B7JW24_RIPO1|nr:type ISP restriction/modification enzyme [Rippkaea orientalis]ACK65713.1 adenine specific DNA methyltransferase [Rippkaea orientalis PCC 8801]